MWFKIFLFSYFLINSYQISQIEGVWITQDDETGKKKSEILLYRNEDKLYGKILHLLLEEDKGKLCVNCKGKNKNLPIEGMTIVEGLKFNSKSWEEGTILLLRSETGWVQVSQGRSIEGCPRASGPFVMSMFTNH